MNDDLKAIIQCIHRPGQLRRLSGPMAAGPGGGRGRGSNLLRYTHNTATNIVDTQTTNIVDTQTTPARKPYVDDNNLFMLILMTYLKPTPVMNGLFSK
jgi:hypothetical protein